MAVLAPRLRALAETVYSYYAAWETEGLTRTDPRGAAGRLPQAGRPLARMRRSPTLSRSGPPPMSPRRNRASMRAGMPRAANATLHRLPRPPLGGGRDRRECLEPPGRRDRRGRDHPSCRPRWLRRGLGEPLRHLADEAGRQCPRRGSALPDRPGRGVQTSSIRPERNGKPTVRSTLIAYAEPSCPMRCLPDDWKGFCTY